MRETENEREVSTVQQRIAQVARERPAEVFTSLNHYLDVEWLKEAYYRVKPASAPGVDGQRWSEYGKDLTENLSRLLDRVKSGSYVAPPVKRMHIPKGEGGKETRAIGMPTIEDKVLQRAVKMLLEPIYEEDFKYFSYGFRPGRTAHEALTAIWSQGGDPRMKWVLEVDIRKYFDTIRHDWLRTILDRRVRDGVIRRLINKWLKAGVWEKGEISYSQEGTPQGGVISPLLSNIYLHEVLDSWFVETVRPRLKGRRYLVRFADDFVLGFERKEDAEKVYKALFRRFERYGLSLHPEKTRLVAFGQPEEDGQEASRPESFDFLGFTHYRAKSRKGRWTVKRKTASKRLRRSLKAINQWCRTNRHRPLWEQVGTLKRKLKGHYGYYGITDNADALRRYRWEVIKIWKKWLGRRGDPNGMPWPRMNQVLRIFSLPPARVVHSFFAANP